MKSMTGYGCASRSIKRFDVTLELSSVNRRGLDFNVSLPREWQSLEYGLLKRLKETLSRGKVNAIFSVKAPASGVSELLPAREAQEAVQQMKELAKACHLTFEPSAELLFRVVQTSSSGTVLPEASSVSSALLEMVSEAVSQLDSMRGNEGEALKVDLKSRLDAMDKHLSGVVEAVKGTPINYRDQLLERIAALGLDIDIKDERVLKEVALFADKTDVSEEVTRLLSHFEQFSKALEKNEPVGRPMDFLCQEINREVNTIGSKANNIEVTGFVLEMKNELEKIREQVQNVE